MTIARGDTARRAARTALVLARRRARQAARRVRDQAPLYLAIAAGGVAGSLLRWLVSIMFEAGPFPAATFLVNILGSFAIGFIAEATGPSGRVFIGPRRRQFAMTGVCGGFTTFSSFTLETARFFGDGALVMGGVYLAASIITWIGAVWLGEMAAARINRLRGA
jgi:CrcB protein